MYAGSILLDQRKLVFHAFRCFFAFIKHNTQTAGLVGKAVAITKIWFRFEFDSNSIRLHFDCVTTILWRKKRHPLFTARRYA